QPRLIPVPIALATEVRLVTALSGAVAIGQGTPVAEVEVRLSSGRSFPFLLRAGIDTAEWAWDRADVRPVVAHQQPPADESWAEDGFAGHRYATALKLPGRYFVDAVHVRALAPPASLTV